jgi:hypothetical protein
MMVGVKMKVMSSSIVCTNTKNIHILKSYINVISVPDIRHLINACLALKASLQYQADSNIHETAQHCLNSKDIDNDYGTEETIKSFATMLKLISGTLVGGVKYSDLYIDSNEDKDNSSTNSHVTNNDKDQNKNNNQQKIPPLPKIA